ncbi:hypothetical protein SARC_04483 [Sphaeroforma arctica JP610]|uniref:CBM20 domain-containing protein n=1 Tax=Sphaeroforma arctica JP610 TaxID=667725 RepID=A0A0L0G2A5_9EUKA|nr:hypothetical protein SARC_04483 [Sphaeroforma arctica JP610]KNC83267.1 hypothetical protein SARC_04483 [Sphaeroforma arctica JP610]|eukprot:XP_014157169.1 hypothetical protein SARC_04483 [Sphaeroforma arctica JP610]
MPKVSPAGLRRSGDSKSSLRGYWVRVRFIIRCNTEYGESLAIVGSSSEIGKWNVASRENLVWCDDGTWQKTIDYYRDAEENLDVEYKLIIVRYAGTTQVCWEDGLNRRLQHPTVDVGCVSNVCRKEVMVFPDYPEWQDYGLKKFKEVTFSTAGGVLSFNIACAKASHTDMLSTFLTGLRPETRARYGAHPLTAEYAAEACDYGSDANRLKTHLLIISPGPKPEVVGYILMDQSEITHEHERYRKLYNTHLESPVDIFFAPVMGDKYQNRGIASSVIPVVKKHIEDIRARSIVLLGGVQQTNASAVHFYQKSGFHKYGEFTWDNLVNVDMRLEVR